MCALPGKMPELLLCRLGGESARAAGASLQGGASGAGLPLRSWLKRGISRVQHAAGLPRPSGDGALPLLPADYRGKCVRLHCLHLLGEEHCAVAVRSRPLGGLVLKGHDPGVSAGIWRWDEL